MAKPKRQVVGLHGRSTGSTGSTDELKLAQAIREESFRRYVVFPEEYREAEAGALALWVMHTHAFEAARFTPYMMVHSLTSEAGKSTVFKVARMLVRRPWSVVQPTRAALYNKIDAQQPTLLIDEGDEIRDSSALRAVLNSGFEPGTPVAIVGRDFNVFCPKMFAGIVDDKPFLTGANLSRCIPLPMRRRMPDEHAEPFRPALAETHLDPLHDALEQWATHAVVRELRDAVPVRPEGLTDRQGDMWEPLFAIADLIGEPWASASRDWATTLSAAAPERPDPLVQILADCKQVLDTYPGGFIPSAELAELRNALADRDYDAELGQISLGKKLAKLGCGPDPNAHRPGGRTGPSVRGYVVRRRDGSYTRPWADAFKRYLSNL